MKKFLSMILPLVLIASMAGCSGKDDSSKADTSTNDTSDASSVAEEEKTAEKGFTVDGTKLLDANGNEFVMRGINHAHTWYKELITEAVPAIAATGSNTIRLVFSDGGQWDKDDIDSVRTAIELCKANDMIVVAEVHDATGKDDEESLDKAVDYWLEMKDVLIGNEDYVILNIANEWAGQWDSEIWRDGYVKAIPKIRDAGIKNTIMIDSAGWGQYPQSIADFGKEVFEADSEKNTMFSVHMYEYAGGSENKIESSIKSATDQDLCIVVGEFGYKHYNGDVDEEYILKYCTENNIGYLGWSWKGNGEGVEYLDIATEWDGSALSEDWGEILINSENGIKATSKKCSVFE